MVLQTLDRVFSSPARASLLLIGLAGLAAVLLAAAPATALAGGVSDWQHEWEVLRLVTALQHRMPPLRGPVIVDLGDSVTRESITTDGGWTTQLRARAGQAGKELPRAWTLAGHDQTFGMDEQLVDALPAGLGGRYHGIVLIGVGLSRFIGAPYAQPPPAITPATPGVLPALSPWRRHLYDGRLPLAPALKRALVASWRERRWAAFRENAAANFNAIERVVRTCAAKGLRPVLIDQPLNTRLVGSALWRPRREIRSRCDEFVARYGRTFGLRYLQLAGSGTIPSSDFWDLHHLLRPGARIWQSRLTDELVRLVPARRR